MGCPPAMFTLVAMRLRRVPPHTIVTARISAVKAGIEVTLNDLEAHFLAGGSFEYEKLYDVAPELKRGGARHDSLVYAAKQEIALHKILKDGGFDAFTSNFEDLGSLKQLPGLAVCEVR